MHDLDDLMSDIEDYENSVSPSRKTRDEDLDELLGYGKEPESGNVQPDTEQKRVRIGRVEKFFSNLGVAAISLTSSLKLGDTIEIDSPDEPVRMIVSSMQINKKSVKSASKGSSVGIKIDGSVNSGDTVYAIR
ncbi:MAG: hypothetical protein KGI06_01265 [Candidatus Micrarchaeota archaeon]|nr:hypothetical protein [Candidatus Micrarchaeota archaeon]